MRIDPIYLHLLTSTCKQHIAMCRPRKDTLFYVWVTVINAIVGIWVACASSREYGFEMKNNLYILLIMFNFDLVL